MSGGVPEGYRTVSPYLVVRDAEAAVRFVVDVLGGVERRADVGEAGGAHHEIEVGDSLVMIGQSPEGQAFPAMLHVYVEDADAVFQRALAAGAAVAQEPHDTSFGDHRAAVDDPWGNQWWIATRSRVEPATPE